MAMAWPFFAGDPVPTFASANWKPGGPAVIKLRSAAGSAAGAEKARREAAAWVKEARVSRMLADEIAVQGSEIEIVAGLTQNCT